jgi:hypothetical protein
MKGGNDHELHAGSLNRRDVETARASEFFKATYAAIDKRTKSTQGAKVAARGRHRQQSSAAPRNNNGMVGQFGKSVAIDLLAFAQKIIEQM